MKLVKLEQTAFYSRAVLVSNEHFVTIETSGPYAYEPTSDWSVRVYQGREVGMQTIDYMSRDGVARFAAGLVLALTGGES